MQVTTIGLDIAKNVFQVHGIDAIGATIAATVPDPKVFRPGRNFAAWIGIVPRQTSGNRSSGRSPNGATAICGVS